jgi:integrase
LNALPTRADVHPDYFFWSVNSKHKSLTGRWQRKLERLNDYLYISKDDGTPMKFHSHQLRDTFAVTQLLSGTSMQDLSKMLAHRSVKITEGCVATFRIAAGDMKELRNDNSTGNLQMAADRTQPHTLCGSVVSPLFSFAARC